MKDKTKLGFLKELKKPTTPQPKQAFNYSKPVSKIDQPKAMGIIQRNREHKSVPVDKSTNFAVEQSSAKNSHKGK